MKLTLIVDNDDWEVVHCLKGVVCVKYVSNLFSSRISEANLVCL